MEVEYNSERGRVLSTPPRTGIGVLSGTDVWIGRFAALNIAAFNT